MSAPVAFTTAVVCRPSMIRPASIFVLLFACGSSPRPATTNVLAHGTIVWPSVLDHTSTPESHREAALLVLDQTGVRAAMVTMQNIALKQQIAINASLAQYETVMREFLSRYASFDALRDDLARIYMARFSELQLRQIAAFYQTPTGSRAVELLPKLVEEGARLGASKVQEHQAELVEMIQRATPTP